MTITDFIAKNAGVTPKVDIVSSWESRIVAQSLHVAGRSGAENYIARYGKGWKTPKAIMFARCAELKGFPALALRFWEEAFFLETGVRAELTQISLKKDGEVVRTVTTDVKVVSLPVPAIKSGFGHYPQLLVQVDRVTAMSIARDDRYGVQEKKDGDRVMESVKNGVVTAGNKKSLVRPIPLNVEKALKRLGVGQDFVSDSELIGTKIWMFDLLEIDGEDIRSWPAARRYEALVEMIEFARETGRLDADSIEVIPMAVTLDEKLALIARLEREGKEGFVMKLLSAPAVAGEKHGTQFKHQFRIINACIVGNRNGVKESVEVFVLRKDGSRRSMGFATTIGRKFPQPGEIAEIENLYTHTGPDGKFAQAVYLRIRTDADASDCQESKLRVKDEEVA